MSESKVSQLKNITLKIGSGATPTGGQNAYHENGISLIRSQNVLDFVFSTNGLAFINEEQAKALDGVSVEEDDILLNITGDSIARACIVPKNILPARVNQHVSIIRCKEGVSSQYVFFYLQYLKPYLLKICRVGGTRNALTKEAIEKLQIELPNFIIQKSIASVLTVLDSKIALNNRINAELEAMAKTIYDYWFVQFDFPDTDGKPYKSSGGKMVYNKELKREIPEGWTDGVLSDIANITMGQSPAGESYNEDGEGMIFYQGCTDFGTRFPSVRKYTTQPTRFARQGDILLSVRAPVGSLNIAKEDCCIGRGLAALNSKDKCIAYLFGVMVNLKQIFDRRNTDGTTFGSITKDDLFTLKVVKPSKEVLEKYHSLINPCFEKQNLIAEENHQLASLRDWLLPMLMNGQVKVVGDMASKEYKLPDVGVLVAAESEVELKSESKIPDNRRPFAKQVLGGKIVSEFLNEEQFTHIKFQKLQYLAEHIIEEDLCWNYYRQSAGPYDNKFMHTVANNLKRNAWFEEKNYKYISLPKAENIERYYQGYFGDKAHKLDKLFKLLLNKSEAFCEAVATIYAVWNNHIIQELAFDVERIKTDFFNWSSRKGDNFTEEYFDSSLQWMLTNDIIPTGFGDLIKEKKK